MHKLLAVVGLLVGLSCAARADTITPNYHFVVPSPSSTGWGLKLNADLVNIDTAMATGFQASGASTGTLTNVKASTGTCGAGYAAQALASGYITCIAIASEVSTNTLTGILPKSKGGTENTTGAAASVASGGVDFSTITTALNGKISTGGQAGSVASGGVDFSTITTALNGKISTGGQAGSVAAGGVDLSTITIAIQAVANSTFTKTAGGDLTGTYPSPTLATNGGTAGRYGSATVVPTIDIDAKGRVIFVASNTITSSGGAAVSSVTFTCLSANPSPLVEHQMWVLCSDSQAYITQNGAAVKLSTGASGGGDVTKTGNNAMTGNNSEAGTWTATSASTVTLACASCTVSGPLLIKGGVFGDTSNSTWTYINSTFGTSNAYWTSVTGTTVTLTSHGGHICAFFACTLAAETSGRRAFGSFLYNGALIDGMTASQGFIGTYGSGGPAAQIASPWIHCSQGTYANGTSVSVVAVIQAPDGTTVDVDYYNIQVCQMFAWEMR